MADRAPLIVLGYETVGYPDRGPIMVQFNGRAPRSTMCDIVGDINTRFARLLLEKRMNIESDDNLLRLGEIMHVLDWAFDRLAELGPIELAIAADNTSRARLINNLIFRFAEDHLPAESDISVDVVTQQSHFVFPGAKVRIHMATDDSFRIIVNRNVQTSLWNCSDRQSILPGMPDRDVNFYIAYRPDTTFQSVQRVAVGLYEWGEPRELRLIAVDEWRSRMGELRTADPSVDHVSIPVSLKPFTHQGRLGA